MRLIILPFAACLLLRVDSKPTRADHPVITWHQTVDDVSFKVPLRGCPEDDSSFYEITAGAVTMTCKDGDQDEEKVDVELREDVVPSSSSCAASAFFRTVECKMAKRMQMPWDRLTATADGVPDHTLNYLNGSAVSLPIIFDEYANATKNRGAKRLSGSEIAEAIKTVPTVVLQLEHPWCEACRPSAIAVGQVAGEFKREIAKKQIMFGYADAREERALVRQLGATCGGCKVFVHTGNLHADSAVPEWVSIDASWSKVGKRRSRLPARPPPPTPPAAAAADIGQAALPSRCVCL